MRRWRIPPVAVLGWGVLIGCTVAGMTPAQAQDIRPLSIRQLVNGPMFLHQGGPLTQLFRISGTPGNPAASKAALAQSERLAGFGSLPAAKLQYVHLLQTLGIAQAVERKGASVRLKQTGTHQITGTASRPTLIFPVQLQEAPTPHGPWTGQSYTLRLTYVGHALQPGFAPVPTLAAMALVAR